MTTRNRGELMVEDDIYQLSRSYINGIWTEGESSRTYDNLNPFDGTIITTVSIANKKQIEFAFENSLDASKKWAKSTAEERKDVLYRTMNYLKENEEKYARMITRETGSTVRKARSEIRKSIEILEEAMKVVNEINVTKEIPSSIEGKVSRVYRFPIGVVTCITPFNAPLVLAMRTLTFSLALGNSVVLKPDIQVGISGGGIIAKAFQEGGLPAGVLNVVITDIEEAGDSFITAPQSSFISFTGSTNVGKRIGSIAGGLLKRVALELGGNSPFVVLADAEVDRAVDAAIFGKFTHQGQICMSVNRFIVHKNLAEEFTSKFVERAKNLQSGDPLDPRNVIGPIMNKTQIDKVMSCIKQAKDEGLELVLEGKRSGNVITPYVFANVKNDSTLAQTEIFGPVATIITAENDEEAIRLASEVKYGLSSSIFTSDLDVGVDAALKINSGMSHINDQTINDQANAPFGGTKESGVGRFGNPWIVEELTTVKWVSIQKKYREFPF
jgi:aldehyde dehydrogenase (NAD+)